MTATAVSTSQINLSWNYDPNATSYHIYWNTSQAWNNGNGWTYLGQFNGTSIIQNGLTSGTTYYYQLYDEGNGTNYITSDAASAKATTENGIISSLSIIPSSLSESSTSGTDVIFVTSNISWSASSNESWLTITSGNNGSDNGTVNVSFTANTGSSRSAIITVSASGVTSQTVNVTQDAGPSTLSVSPSTLEIGAGSGSTANFNITSNTSWSVSSNQTWITASSSSGSDNTSITLTASSNPTNQARSVTITVSASGVFSQTVTVTQDAGPATLYVSPTTLEISADAGSTETFNITSNTSWEVSSNETWISSSSASGSDNTTITLTASENPTNSTRTATITISASGVFSQTVTVTQDAGPATLSVSPSTLEIGTETGSTATFNITSNTTWNLSSNQNWITLSSASGSGNATITLTATLNSTTETRTADITVSGNGIFSQTVTVTQQSGTGLSELTEADVKLYPNPVIDNLILSLPNMSDQWRFSIYNMLGIEIYSSNVTNSITTIDMSKYPAGVYIIKISLPDQGIITKKFIKQ